MFIRTKTNKNSPRTSVQIVESIRIGSKVKQNIVKHVGTAYNDEELIELKMLAASIKTKLEQGPQLPLFSEDKTDKQIQKTIDRSVAYPDEDYQIDVRDLDEESRNISGIHDIYGKLYDELGFKKVIANPARHQQTFKMLKEIVLARIACPDSKRGSVRQLEDNFGVSLQLDAVYRMMDKLDDKAIGRLNDIAYQTSTDLLGGKIDVIFFDATTIYFESFTEDEFKANGYSKDLKFNQPQVLLALMVTKEGLPIGYKAFSGDTYEGHTLIPALSQLKKEYSLDQVVYVADSGMFNEDNLTELEQLEDHQFNYIVGARIKNLPNHLKENILNQENYQILGNGISTAEFEHKGRKLIVSYSEKRAKKDKSDRLKGIEKLRVKLSKDRSIKNQLSNQGYRKYLRLDNANEGILHIDEEKIASAAQWDGLKGLIVNKENHLSHSDVLKQYNNLWQVEESFRITKHDLKIRPVYHFKPRRIKAHLAIAFMAYTLVRHLEYRVKLQYKKLSPKEIKRSLLAIEISILFCNKKRIRYGLPSAMNQQARKIYALMEVKRSQKAFIIKKL